MIKKIISYFKWKNNPQNEDEEVVKKIDETFNYICTSYPDRDTHFHLMETYLQVLSGAWMIDDINDESTQMGALSKTYLLSCIPKHKAWRIIGIFMLNEFDPEWYKNNTIFQEEFNEYMLPILEIQEEWKIEELYKKNNPKGEMLGV